MQEPGWWTLPAVRTGDVYMIQASFLLRPGPSVVDAAQALGNLMWPSDVPQPVTLPAGSCFKLDLEPGQRCRPTALPSFFKPLLGELE